MVWFATSKFIQNLYKRKNLGKLGNYELGDLKNILFPSLISEVILQLIKQIPQKNPIHVLRSDLGQKATY